MKLLKYCAHVSCVCCGETFSPAQTEALAAHLHSVEHYESAVLYCAARERTRTADQATSAAKARSKSQDTSAGESAGEQS